MSEPASVPVLDAVGLRLGYGGPPVLDRVELRVNRGEFWFFLGPNGQGKTTLIGGLMGRVRPELGRVTFHGEYAQRDRLGFVPQQCGLKPTLPTTVGEFVRLGLVGISCRKPAREQRLAKALADVGLDAMQRKEFWSLSGGQRQRALVARALIRDPRLLIADEPTSGLDLSVETALYQSLAELNRAEQLTVILVTHDLAVAARYGTHLAVIAHGRVAAGPADEILRSGKLEEAYEVPIAVSHDAAGVVSVQLRPTGRAAC